MANRSSDRRYWPVKKLVPSFQPLKLTQDVVVVLLKVLALGQRICHRTGTQPTMKKTCPWLCYLDLDQQFEEIDHSKAFLVCWCQFSASKDLVSSTFMVDFSIQCSPSWPRSWRTTLVTSSTAPKALAVAWWLRPVARCWRKPLRGQTGCNTQPWWPLEWWPRPRRGAKIGPNLGWSRAHINISNESHGMYWHLIIKWPCFCSFSLFDSQRLQYPCTTAINHH